MVLNDSAGKHETLVMKFGGTSVGTPAAMRQVVSIICDERKTWRRLVVITSALSGVTDLLLSMASGKVDVLEAAATLRDRRLD